MAVTNANKAKQQHVDERPDTPIAPQVESFTNGVNGDLNLNFSREQWMDMAGAVSIAAGQAAIERSYDQMFRYNALSATLATRLVWGSSIAGVLGESPPKVRAAGA